MLKDDIDLMQIQQRQFNDYDDAAKALLVRGFQLIQLPYLYERRRDNIRAFLSGVRGTKRATIHTWRVK